MTPDPSTTLRDLIVLLVLFGSTYADPHRDSKFDPSLKTKWRKSIRIWGWATDLWHFIKWAEFYPPRALVLYLLFGFPWASWTVAGQWAGCAAAGWFVWWLGKPQEWKKS